MATVRISQLTAITTPTDDDVFIINDADTNTRKISFANLTQGLLNTSSIAQTKTGALTIGGTLTASSNLVVDTNTFFVDATNNRVGIKNILPNTELDIDGTIHVRNANSIQFGDANDSNYAAIKAPSIVAATFTFTLPDALPAATNLLAVNNAGVMEYSVGVTYNNVDDVIELAGVRLTDQGSVRFYEDVANGSEYIQFNAPVALATTNTYQLPNAFPAASGYVLAATTAGVLSWASNGAGAAGAAGEIQFNSAGSLGADPDFVWNSGTNTLETTNITLTGALDVQGNVDLGNAITDTISFNGRVDTDIIPITDGNHDLGTSLLKFAEAHIDDVFAYGSVELGTTTADLISFNGAIDTDILPTGSVDIGASANQWSNIFISGAYIENNVSTSYSRSQAAVVAAASFDVVIGTAAVANSAKILIQARDVITGDIEFYEHFVTHDGAGTISEISSSNVQAPTPGLFLTAASTAVNGSDIELSVTNTAVSTNNLDISVQIIATA